MLLKLFYLRQKRLMTIYMQIKCQIKGSVSHYASLLFSLGTIIITKKNLCNKMMIKNSKVSRWRKWFRHWFLFGVFFSHLSPKMTTISTISFLLCIQATLETTSKISTRLSSKSESLAFAKKNQKNKTAFLFSSCSVHQIFHLRD